MTKPESSGNGNFRYTHTRAHAGGEVGTWGVFMISIMWISEAQNTHDALTEAQKAGGARGRRGAVVVSY
jgi:hypothetical protein